MPQFGYELDLSIASAALVPLIKAGRRCARHGPAGGFVRGQVGRLRQATVLGSRAERRYACLCRLVA